MIKEECTVMKCDSVFIMMKNVSVLLNMVCREKAKHFYVKMNLSKKSGIIIVGIFD